MYKDYGGTHIYNPKNIGKGGNYTKFIVKITTVNVGRGKHVFVKCTRISYFMRDQSGENISSKSKHISPATSISSFALLTLNKINRENRDFFLKRNA